MAICPVWQDKQNGRKGGVASTVRRGESRQEMSGNSWETSPHFLPHDKPAKKPILCKPSKCSGLAWTFLPVTPAALYNDGKVSQCSFYIGGTGSTSNGSGGNEIQSCSPGSMVIQRVLPLMTMKPNFTQIV